MACALVFIWSGFVRSGLGFGGAALGLPLMLFIIPDVALWLPVIGQHLLFFSLITLFGKTRLIDWTAIRHCIRWAFVPKIIGVLGLVSLPVIWVATFIYILCGVYAISWIFKFKVTFATKWQERFMLMIGGYISGVALSSAPLFVPIFVKYVSKEKIRVTLFAFWAIVVSIKLMSFIVLTVPLHWEIALLTLPAAALGHYFGSIAHSAMVNNQYLMQLNMGIALLLICIIGFARLFG